jgi:hypothetical protein
MEQMKSNRALKIESRASQMLLSREEKDGEKERSRDEGVEVES